MIFQLRITVLRNVSENFDSNESIKSKYLYISLTGKPLHHNGIDDQISLEKS